MIPRPLQVGLIAFCLGFTSGCIPDGDSINSFDPDIIAAKSDILGFASLKYRKSIFEYVFVNDLEESDTIRLDEYVFTWKDRSNSSIKIWNLTSDDLVDSCIYASKPTDSLFIYGTKIKEYGQIEQVATFPHYMEFNTENKAQEYLNTGSNAYMNYMSAIKLIKSDSNLVRRFRESGGIYYTFDSFYFTGLLKKGGKIFYFKNEKVVGKNSSEIILDLLGENKNPS